MKRSVPLSLLVLAVLVGAVLQYPQIVSSSSSGKRIPVRAVPKTSNLTPVFATTLNVDRTDDSFANDCTDEPDDCTLRGAILSANSNLSADPVIISLKPGATYGLTLNDGTQENGAASGDLDITTSLHTVTFVGGGSSGPNATIIDGAGLNTNFRDRVFHVTGSGVTVTFQNLVIQNGQAVDDGTEGVSLNPRNQNTHRAGGGILNNGGSVTLDNVLIQSCQALGRADTNANPAGILEARGGGVASLGATGTVVVTNSTLSGNAAQGGSAPQNFNNKNAGSNAKGGTIYFEGGTLNISASRIDSSAANGAMVAPSTKQPGQRWLWWIGPGRRSVGRRRNSSIITPRLIVLAQGGNAGGGGNSGGPGGAADGGGLRVSVTLR